MNGNQIRSEGKELEKPFGTERDKLTDQRDETAVKERTRLFHAAVGASPVPIVVIDPDTSVRLWNPAAERLFGRSKQDVIGGLIPIVPFEKRGECARLRNAVGEGETRAGVETYRARRHGSRVDPLAAADRAGGIDAIVLLFGGRAERQRTETAGQKALQALTTFCEMGEVVAGELDSGQLLQTITDACTLISGAQFGAASYSYNVADDEGAHYLLYALSGTPRQARGTFAMQRKTNEFAEAFAREAIVRSGDVTKDPWYGQTIPYQGLSPERLPVTSYLVVPMIGRSGEVLGGLFLGHPDPAVFTEESKRVVVALAAHAAIAIDNARLYEAERRTRTAAEAANRTKDEFLAMLGHELRSPLSTVRNGIVTARLDPARRDRALELARRGTEQLTRLVDDLLDVARITHGKITLRRAAVPFAQIVERAIESARQLIEERGHAITVSLLETDLQVDGDALRLEQVIVNLVSNAAKYMYPGGQITVVVAHEDGEAVVRVRDTGMGIAPDVLPRVFDLFAQAQQALDRAQGGLGIGLALVKRLVELHDGCVEAHSDGCGRGAEFVVRLPAVGPAGKAAAPRSPGEASRRR